MSLCFKNVLEICWFGGGARLYHKLDFFHSAGEGSAGGGCELEVTVTVDAGYGGTKGLAFME